MANNMGYNMTTVNKNGDVMCASCRRKVSVADAKVCSCCDKFVCTRCATYRRQGNPYGYVCRGCYNKLK